MWVMCSLVARLQRDAGSLRGDAVARTGPTRRRWRSRSSVVDAADAGLASSKKATATIRAEGMSLFSWRLSFKEPKSLARASSETSLRIISMALSSIKACAMKAT